MITRIILYFCLLASWLKLTQLNVEKWGVRGSNSDPCINYAMSLPTKLNSHRPIVYFFNYQIYHLFPLKNIYIYYLFHKLSIFIWVVLTCALRAHVKKPKKRYIPYNFVHSIH